MLQPARTAPEFLDRTVIYQLFLRSFTPQGTIKAAAGLLDHLAELGVDIVYLCPMAQSDDDERQSYWSKRQLASQLGNPKNPYRIKDFFRIDEEYGNDEDLLAFVRKAHNLGLKVMLDLVYLHCGPQAVFIEDQPDFVKRNPDGSVLYGPWNFPLINFESTGLREYLWRNMTYFVERFDVDGYRCDVGDGVPLDFWEEGRRRLEALKPEIVLLNEGTRPDYLLTAFDINYDFKWSALLLKCFKGESTAADLIAYWREQNEKLPVGGRCLKAIDNHDIANDSYDDRIETVLGGKAVEAALLVNFTLDGIPFLYNGYEVADTVRHSIYGNRFYGKNMFIDWTGALTNRGKSRLTFMQSLTRLRHTQMALAGGAVAWLDHDQPEKVLAFTRTRDDEKLLVVVNCADQPLRARIDLDSIPDGCVLVRGAAAEETCGRLAVSLLPYGFLVARLD